MRKNFVRLIIMLTMIFSISSNLCNLSFATDYDRELTLLNVVKTWHGEDETSWERHIGIKETNNYVVYEAAIWDDYVCLYKFGTEFDSFELDGQDYRDQFLISRYEISGGRDSFEGSKDIAEAFKDIFRIMIEESPAKHYGIKCTGHGSGEGYMFTSTMKPDDVQEFLTYAKDLLGRNIDFYDMSTNCNQGSVGMMNAFYPYFDYVLASELTVGGYKIDEEYKKDFMNVMDFYRYPDIFSQDITLEQKLIELVNLKRTSWEYSSKDMITNETKQSLSLLKMDEYKPLLNMVRDEIKDKNIDNIDYNEDLKTIIENLNNYEIMDRYENLIVLRETNKDFFNWDENTDALVVNSLEDILEFDKYDNSSDMNEDSNIDNNNYDEESNNSNIPFWTVEDFYDREEYNYDINEYQVKTYTHTNASYVCIYFESVYINGEGNCLYILDKDNNVVERFESDSKDKWIIVPGDTAYIYLSADIQKGRCIYDITRAAYHID
ncbi:hypothetical protein WG909_05560 [Peptostreptococcaceae bacterium AGR-M142]